MKKQIKVGQTLTYKSKKRFDGLTAKVKVLTIVNPDRVKVETTDRPVKMKFNCKPSRLS